VGVPRHAFGDQYRATDLVIPGSGTVELVYTPANGGAPERHEVHTFDGAGVVMGMYNTEPSIRGFAKACFEYALDRQW
jgi:isocitrate dehydrogenase